MRHGNAEVTTDEWVGVLRPSVFRAIGRHRKQAQSEGNVELVALLNLMEELIGHVEEHEPVSHEDALQRRMLREQAWLLKS